MSAAQPCPLPSPMKAAMSPQSSQPPMMIIMRHAARPCLGAGAAGRGSCDNVPMQCHYALYGAAAASHRAAVRRPRRRCGLLKASRRRSGKVGSGQRLIGQALAQVPHGLYDDGRPSAFPAAAFWARRLNSDRHRALVYSHAVGHIPGHFDHKTVQISATRR